jgi:hypothetical protein
VICTLAPIEDLVIFLISTIHRKKKMFPIKLHACFMLSWIRYRHSLVQCLGHLFTLLRSWYSHYLDHGDHEAWFQVLETASCRNAGKCCINKTQSGRTLPRILHKRELRAPGCPFYSGHGGCLHGTILWLKKQKGY